MVALLIRLGAEVEPYCLFISDYATAVMLLENHHGLANSVVDGISPLYIPFRHVRMLVEGCEGNT